MEPIEFNDLPETHPGPIPVGTPRTARLASVRRGVIADIVFRWAVFACALSVLASVVLVASQLIYGSRLTLARFGLSFFRSSSWDPVAGEFGALPFIYGTVVSSLLAVLIAAELWFFRRLKWI